MKCILYRTLNCDLAMYPINCLTGFVEIWYGWLPLVFILLFPFLSKYNKLQRMLWVILCTTLWNTPFPVSFSNKERLSLTMSDFMATQQKAAWTVLNSLPHPTPYQLISYSRTPFWEANCHSASHEILYPLLNSEVQYCFPTAPL